MKLVTSFIFSLILCSSCIPRNLQNKSLTKAVNDSTLPPQIEKAPSAERRDTNPKFPESSPDDDEGESRPNPNIGQTELSLCKSSDTSLSKITKQGKEGEEIGSIILRGNAYKFYNNFIKAGVPEIPLKHALEYYDKNPDTFKNKNYISIADYTKNSSEKRFWLLSMTDGSVINEKVSHGGGDPKLDKYTGNGELKKCINDNGTKTNMTRPGIYVTKDLYYSEKHDRIIKKDQNWPKIDGNYNGLELAGLEASNEDANRSGVVMHGANYNHEEGIMGRSYGCPAFVPEKAKEIISKVKGGSLFYAYAPQCDK